MTYLTCLTLTSCQNLDHLGIALASTNTMNKLYTDPSRRFSFEYPATCRLRNFSAGFDFLIIEGVHHDELLQIHGMPFGDDLPFTLDRIQSMFPALRVDDLAYCSVGRGHIVHALSFRSSRPSESVTTEIWFVHHDRLYQLVASPDSQPLLDSIIAAWVFDPSESPAPDATSALEQERS